MLAKRIIPCLDVKDGRVVKGVNFVGLRDAGDPVEVAQRYDAEGADELTFLDITASHERAPDHPRRRGAHRRDGLHAAHRRRRRARAARTSATCSTPAPTRSSINTAAVQNPDFVRAAAERFGSQCIVVAIDAKRVDADGEPLRWEVFTHGGRTPTGLDAVEWARRMEAVGAGEILLTSMDRDGTKDGYDLELTRAIADAVSVPVIASGGVGTLEHIYEGLTAGGADRRARRLDLPLPRVHRPAVQGVPRRPRRPGAQLNRPRGDRSAPARFGSNPISRLGADRAVRACARDARAARRGSASGPSASGAAPE